MSDSIIRRYTVTITKDITVELPARFAEPSMIADWSSGLWPIDSVEDIAMHAAEMAAKGYGGYELDGLGLLAPSYSKHPREPDVKFTEHYEDAEVEPSHDP